MTCSVPHCCSLLRSHRARRGQDWGRKRELYAQGGADWYWLVDPDAHEVTTMRNEGGSFIVTGQLSDNVVHELDEPMQVTLNLRALFG